MQISPPAFVRIAAWQRILKFCAQTAAQSKFEIKFYVYIAGAIFFAAIKFSTGFYRGEILYGKIPLSKILDKILRRNFRVPYPKNRGKNGAKSRQDRRKILYEAGKRKEREFFAKFTTKFHRQKLVQGRPKPL